MVFRRRKKSFPKTPIKCKNYKEQLKKEKEMRCPSCRKKTLKEIGHGTGVKVANTGDISKDFDVTLTSVDYKCLNCGFTGTALFKDMSSPTSSELNNMSKDDIGTIFKRMMGE